MNNPPFFLWFPMVKRGLTSPAYFFWSGEGEIREIREGRAFGLIQSRRTDGSNGYGYGF